MVIALNIQQQWAWQARHLFFYVLVTTDGTADVAVTATVAVAFAVACTFSMQKWAWQRQNAAWRLLLLLLLLPVAIADEPIPNSAGLAGQEPAKQNHTITLCIADAGA